MSDQYEPVSAKTATLSLVRRKVRATQRYEAGANFHETPENEAIATQPIHIRFGKPDAVHIYFTFRSDLNFGPIEQRFI